MLSTSQSNYKPQSTSAISLDRIKLDICLNEKRILKWVSFPLKNFLLDQGLTISIIIEKSNNAFRDCQMNLLNTSSKPVSVNIKWSFELINSQLAGDQPRWLIPGLFYNRNSQVYPELPSNDGDFDLKKSISKWWTFRSDLTAVPMVMVWYGQYSAAIILSETSCDYMTGIGFDSRDQKTLLCGCWPYREEPRIRSHSGIIEETQIPHIERGIIAPGACVRVPFWLFESNNNPYAFVPVLRRMYNSVHSQHLDPERYPSSEGCKTAAFGLYHWHYDPEEHALWETCSFDGYFGKNSRQVDRFDMHVGFASGIPYAYSLLQFGKQMNYPEIADAGRHVITRCCASLTPWGSFWSLLRKDEGWSTGWESLDKINPKRHEHGELQSRTLADAVLFAALSAMEEAKSEQSLEWRKAVISNLDWLCSIQRSDGHPGSIYSGKDGSVLTWNSEEGIHWISSLVEGWRLTGNDTYLNAAIKAGRYYRHAVESADLKGAPEGTHMLATSEDPLNALLAYVRLFEATESSDWLSLACKSAELLMTFRWQYNTVFPKGTLLDAYRVRTKGLDISSPNNIHLHPYGLAALPELIKLWDWTGDLYFAKQAISNYHASRQMLARTDGAYDARLGMMTERWYQTPGGVPKGSTLQLSHSWAIGLVLYADLWVLSQAQILVDFDQNIVLPVDDLEVKQNNEIWTIKNTQPEKINVVIRFRNLKRALVNEQIISKNGSLHIMTWPLDSGKEITIKRI